MKDPTADKGSDKSPQKKPAERDEQDKPGNKDNKSKTVRAQTLDEQGTSSTDNKGKTGMAAIVPKR